MILIGGGSRCGKSTAALARLKAAGPRQAFIATGVAGDQEMQERIEHHRLSRDPAITVWEEPIAVADRLASIDGQYDGIVIDCLTFWLSNLMLSGTAGWNESYTELIERSARAVSQVILVTNEVGCGVVPSTLLGRQFRDEQGRLNQLAASHASEVYWMVFGLSMRIK